MVEHSPKILASEEKASTTTTTNFFAVNKLPFNPKRLKSKELNADPLQCKSHDSGRSYPHDTARRLLPLSSLPLFCRRLCTARNGSYNTRAKDSV